MHCWLRHLLSYISNMVYKNILHIDDDEEDSEIFLEAAQEASGSVIVDALYDAREAIDKLIENVLSPDVIFLDLNMPIMDGFQFLREIKSNLDLKHIPVIVLSTSSHEDTIQATKNLGANDFITKPSDYGQLVTILKTFLAQ